MVSNAYIIVKFSYKIKQVTPSLIGRFNLERRKFAVKRVSNGQVTIIRGSNLTLNSIDIQISCHYDVASHFPSKLNPSCN